MTTDSTPTIVYPTAREWLEHAPRFLSPENVEQLRRKVTETLRQRARQSQQYADWLAQQLELLEPAQPVAIVPISETPNDS